MDRGLRWGVRRCRQAGQELAGVPDLPHGNFQSTGPEGWARELLPTPGLLGLPHRKLEFQTVQCVLSPGQEASLRSFPARRPPPPRPQCSSTIPGSKVAREDPQEGAKLTQGKGLLLQCTMQAPDWCFVLFPHFPGEFSVAQRGQGSVTRLHSHEGMGRGQPGIGL